MNKKVLSYFAIFLIPVLYGGYYIMVKISIKEVPVFWVNSLRLLIATVFFLPFTKRLKRMTKRDFRNNLWISLVFFSGVVFQSFALKTTTAGSTGFLAALFIIFTPIIKRIFFKKHVNRWIVIPIAVCLFGYYLMYFQNGDTSLNFGVGEVLGILGAVSIALHMVLTEEYLEGKDSIAYAYMQVLIALFFSLLFAFLFDPMIDLDAVSNRSIYALLYLGVGATVFTYLCQNWGQKTVNATTTSLIVALEPIFATLFGVWIGNESFGSMFVWGGVFIMLGIFLAIYIQK